MDRLPLHRLLVPALAYALLILHFDRPASAASNRRVKVWLMPGGS